VLYKLLQGNYYDVVSVGYDDVQRVSVKGAVSMATPATVLGDDTDASHLTASVRKLHDTI